MSRKVIVILVVAIVAALGISRLLGRAAAPPASVTRAAAGEIEILPADPYTNTLLTARVAGTRGHKADVEGCTWYRNGERISGLTGPTLDPSQFQKGDEIVAEAAAVPGAAVRRSHPVTVRNSRPHISSAMASQHDDRAEIFLRMTASDNDDDRLTFQYVWFRNGEEIAGAGAERLDVSGFHDGDRVHARVTAYDGEENSAPFTSSPIVLGSDAPAITSAPPSTTVEGRYVYQVTTTAHDPGSLNYELLEAPAGMSVDENGRVEWQMPTDQIDVVVHTVAVRVSHSSGGEAVQRFSITTGPVTTAAQ